MKIQLQLTRNRALGSKVIVIPAMRLKLITITPKLTVALTIRIPMIAILAYPFNNLSNQLKLNPYLI